MCLPKNLEAKQLVHTDQNIEGAHTHIDDFVFLLLSRFGVTLKLERHYFLTYGANSPSPHSEQC